MNLRIRKQQIPLLMTSGRALLGPVLIAGAIYQWNGFALAGMVIAALLSDIYDGVLARRWHCDTAAVRLFDSMADTFFYLCTAGALWIMQPGLWRTYAVPLFILLGLEAMRFLFDFRKFGKPASYHSWLAKGWGLVLATAVVGIFAFGHAYPLLPIALWMGIICNFQDLAISIALPEWRRDVKSFWAAWILRREILRSNDGRRHTCGRKYFVKSLIAACLVLAIGPSSFAIVEEGQAAYVSGTSPLIAKGTLGTLDTTFPASLIFRTTTASPVTELEIPYKSITRFEYSSEVAHHLGVLPAIAVGMVRRRERKHFFSISYKDVSGVIQVAVFEVPKHDPRVLLEILRSRAPQACGAVKNSCGGSLFQ